MKLRSLIASGAVLSLLMSAAPAFAALPVVNTFTIATTCVSPVPVTAFTASDSDGTVVGYMITQTSTKPAASDTHWTATPWTSFTTASTGAITLYAWAKDNANGVSNSKTATTTVVAAHNHDAVYVNEGQVDSITTAIMVNGAVTGAKIAAGTITTSNIGNSQITNLLLASNAVTTDKIQDGAVGNLDLANGAVTDAKILGPIGAAKITQGPGSELNADLLDGLHASSFAPVAHTHAQSDVTGLASALAGKADINHNHDGLYQKKYARVIVVSADGNGDFQNPKDAVESIVDASAANPYLVKILPGTYEINGTINDWGFIDIEGSGQNVTKLRKLSVDGSLLLAIWSNYVEIRDMTIESYRTDQAGSTSGIAFQGTRSPTLRNLHVNAIGAASNIAIWMGGPGKPNLVSCDVFAGGGTSAYGIFGEGTGTRFEMRGGSIRAEGAVGSNSCGVFLRGSDLSIAMYDADISGTVDGLCVGIGGFPLWTNTAIAQQSRLGGDRYAVRVEGGDSFFGANTQITAPIFLDAAWPNQGSVKLFQCFDGNYDPVY